MPSRQDPTRHGPTRHGPTRQPHRKVINGAVSPVTALLAVAFLALAATPAAAQYGERCVWSPDGQHLLYLTEQNINKFVACYDVASGKSYRVFTAPNRDELRGVSWSPDGSEFATVSLNTSHPTTVTAHFLPFPRRGQPRTFTNSIGDGYQGFGTIVHAGDALWLKADGTVKMDREHGTIRRVLHADGETVSPIALVGNQLGYLAVKKDTAPQSWELGTIDPVTLVRSPLYDHSKFPGQVIVPNPAFSPEPGRIAVCAYDRATEEHSILVLQDGEIISTLILGHAGDVQPTDLTWSSDGASVFAFLCRRGKAKPTRRMLFESAFSGSASRETELFATPNSTVRRPYGLSISPNGKTAAVVIKYTFFSDPVLLLVDLTDKVRTVTRIDSPPGIEIVALGSDMVVSAANAWQQAWAATDTERRMLVRGGGSTAGMKALTAGAAQVALTSRAVSPTEHALAKAAGIELDVRCIVRDVVVVCVHPDNPMPAIAAIQLQRLFTHKNHRQWSQLGVTIPDTSDDIATAMLLPGSPQYTPFRQAVLNNRSTVTGDAIAADPSALGEFVRTRRNAIACLPIDDALQLGNAVRIVPITNKASVVAPTEAAIKDGRYPLTYSWYIVTRRNSSPRVRAFLMWLDSDEAHRATATVGRRPAK